MIPSALLPSLYILTRVDPTQCSHGPLPQISARRHSLPLQPIHLGVGLPRPRIRTKPNNVVVCSGANSALDSVVMGSISSGCPHSMEGAYSSTLEC